MVDVSDVAFVDAVEVACSILKADPTIGVPVGNRVPSPRPAAFVRVQRVGGVRRSQIIDDARLVIESWANSNQAAHDLAQRARRTLRAAANTVVEGTTVYLPVEFSGPAELPDPTSNQTRVSQTVELPCRGT